jgi:peptidoglycan-N-acetylglucosamine deacetylase
VSGAPVASISLDLDDKWSYLKTHGDPAWQELPSFLHVVIPRMLTLLDDLEIQATFFVVGQDATRASNRELLEAIRDHGHELGNHSHRHEPWLHRYSELETRDELGRAHEAISDATGQELVGFRGPGYSLSIATLRTLRDLGYHYDASLLPTWVGPLARTWYLRSSDLDESQRQERAALFGSWKDGARPLRPFRWDVDGAGIVELPVTTMPLTRLPIHLTYLLYVHERSPALARTYMRTALRLCQLRRVGPSMLLHPLEFLDPTDPEARDLAFLPGVMAQPYGAKRELLAETLSRIGDDFSLQPLRTQAEMLSTNGLRTRLPDLMESTS